MNLDVGRKVSKKARMSMTYHRSKYLSSDPRKRAVSPAVGCVGRQLSLITFTGASVGAAVEEW
jgi:hypothetical protein